MNKIFPYSTVLVAFRGTYSIACYDTLQIGQFLYLFDIVVPNA